MAAYPKVEQAKTALQSQMEREINDYFTTQVNISQNYLFSQADLVKRIAMFENRQYPTGKFDSQGNYKFWYDIITPRIDAEIKNIDFDTKDIEAHSERKDDALAVLINNLKIKEWLRVTGQAEEINSAIEEGAGWGNVVWKKVKDGYERIDIKNFFVINQSAKNLNESPAIERHQLSQSDLYAYEGVWDDIDKVIQECGTEYYSTTPETQAQKTTTPYYEIYERNGEVCLKDLKEQRREAVKKGDEHRYVMARVVAAGVKSQGSYQVNMKYILFASRITKSPYKEYHRGRYKGRWMREGLIELLFDLQVRANQIGNQLAQGLEWASKTIFSTDEKLVMQNVMTDLQNGDIIRAKNLQHVPVRMDGFDQLANEWNRIIELANEIANSREVVQGDNAPSGTPFRTTSLLNSNANKLFDFIREKFAIPLSEIFEDWINPQLINDLRVQEVLRLTGDSDMMERLRDMIVNDWYLNNLVAIGPHDTQTGLMIKEMHKSELMKSNEILMQGNKQMWEDYKPHVSIVITGENSQKDVKLESLKTFITLEADPVRRQALIELALKEAGFDVMSLPKNPPVQPTPQDTGPSGSGGVGNPMKTPATVGAGPSKQAR